MPLELLLARTEETAVAVTGLRAYPTGLQLTLSLRLRRRASGRDAAWLGQGLYHLEPFGAEGLPDELLRFGVQFADGRKATNLTHPLVGDDQEPAPPVLMPEGGGGGDRRWDQQYWLWPLPPPGPLAFVCE